MKSQGVLRLACRPEHFMGRRDSRARKYPLTKPGISC